METIKEKIRNIWLALTFPDGLDEEFDKRCDNAFLNLLEHFVTFCWMLYGVVASISIYFLITREIL